MLGFNSSREPVTGNVAREIRETLKRIEKNSLNEKDLIQKSKQIQKTQYELVKG